MTSVIGAPRPTPTAIFRRVYRRSWIDVFTDWVDRLPGPPWLFYVGIWSLLILIEGIIQSTGGGLVLPTSIHLVFTGSGILALASLHYSDKLAEHALLHFRPAMSCTDEEFAAAQYRITNMPILPTLVAMGIGVVVGILVPIVIPLASRLSLAHFVGTNESIVFNDTLILVNAMIGCVFIYHARHQFATIHDLLKLYTNVDLFNLSPLYAFSNVSALTAITILLATYAWASALPDIFGEVVIFTYFLILVFVAGLTFVLPLWQTHQLLVDEKERLLNEVGQQMETLSRQLYQRLDGGQITDMDNMNKALASLELEYGALKRVPTWPWQPETLRAVIIAVLFPVVVWLIQWGIERAVTV